MRQAVCVQENARGQRRHGTPDRQLDATNMARSDQTSQLVLPTESTPIKTKTNKSACDEKKHAMQKPGKSLFRGRVVGTRASPPDASTPRRSVFTRHTLGVVRTLKYHTTNTNHVICARTCLVVRRTKTKTNVSVREKKNTNSS